MAGVYAVGVGPGARRYLTQEAERVICACDVVVGYKYTLGTIRDIITGKDVRVVTMSDQEKTFASLAGNLGDKSLAVPFTGDVSFSESEVTDRLVELFGDVTLVPGISSVAVAAARASVPLDKARVITFHVTAPIDEKKLELARAVIDGQSLVVIPRPWPSRPDLEFMPSDIAVYLRGMGIDTKHLSADVFESLTMPDEVHWAGAVSDLEGRGFGGMAVMVLNQARPDSYINYRWQWDVQKGNS